MTMADYQMLCDYWDSQPPVHLMVAGYLGIKPRKKRGAPADKGVLDLLRGRPGFSLH